MRPMSWGPGSAGEKLWRQLSWLMLVGRISGKYVMIYPPGVPILVPGEKILKETVENISQYLYNGYNVLGLSKEDQVQVLLKGDFIR